MPGPRPDPAVLQLVLSRTRELLGMDAPSFSLLSQLAAAPGQVPTSAPVAPSQANQPAFGPPPQGTPTPTGSGGFDPVFETALNQMIAASGGKVRITSRHRTPEHQAELFETAVKKCGSEAAARKWVAPPGKSQHGIGVAADLGGDLNWVRQNAARFVLSQPMSWEDWHYELQGSR